MKPLTRIFLCCISTLVICQLAFVGIKREIDSYQIHNTGRLNELLYNKTNFDLLFLGSSRTHLDINPRIIDSICQVNSYNAGMEGANLFEFKMILEAYLENHPSPKWLVLTLDLHSFASTRKFFNYTEYFDYTKNRVIKRYLLESGYNLMRLNIFPFLEMTDFDDNTKGYFIKGMAGNTEIEPGDFQYKGYLSNSDNTISNEMKTPVQLSRMMVMDTAIQYFDDIINICKTRSIRLILTYAPEYRHEIQKNVANSDEILSMIRNKAFQKNLPFLRDDSLSLCSNPLLFANEGHLNRIGAQLYSVELATELNPILQNK